MEIAGAIADSNFILLLQKICCNPRAMCDVQPLRRRNTGVNGHKNDNNVLKYEIAKY